MNPNGYTFGVYGPQDTCRKIKNEWYSTVLTFYGKPYGTYYNGWTVKQDNSPSGYTGGLINVVDFDTARNSDYGGWQYHKYPALWSNYGNMTRHRKKCLYCNRYLKDPDAYREPHDSEKPSSVKYDPETGDELPF